MDPQAKRRIPRCQALFQGLQVVQHLACGFKHFLAFDGQRHAAAAANQQRNAVVALQLLNLSADRALGQAQPCRRFGEVAGGRHFDKGLKGLQRGRSKEFIHAKTE
ncbi:hypothetical protein D3C84_784220 [compost metagenome]